MMESDNHFGEGDIVLVDFRSVLGREQDGMRPAVVMTDARYNVASSYVIVCPITSNARPWPFKMPLPSGLKVRGYVMIDQIKSIDQRRRVMRRIDCLPNGTLDEYRNRLGVLLKLPLSTDH